MKILARVGTPHHQEEKTYTRPGEAKRHLGKRLNTHNEWALRYNHDLARKLAAINEEIQSVDVVTLDIGEVRHWEATDSHTGVRFVFELEKRQT